MHASGQWYVANIYINVYIEYWLVEYPLERVDIRGSPVLTDYAGR